MGLRLDETANMAREAAGGHVSGEFRCTDCGYGAVVQQRTLPQCPMCAGTVWESLGPLQPE